MAAMGLATHRSSPETVPAVAPRNRSVDAYRGFVMLLMMAEVLRLSRVAAAFPDNPFWQFLAWNQTHVAWAGASLHDLIQPSFSFLVGVALPYSIARRESLGTPVRTMLLHTLFRSAILIALGVLLRQRWTLEDTLAQIGLGYPFLFLLGLKPRRWQWIALGVILVGCWAAWALHPGQWTKDWNLGHAVDSALGIRYNRGGYVTLNFIPTLGTMILGLAAGRWLRDSTPGIPYRKFLLAGAAGVALAAILHYTGVNPIVKRIWTPAWVLFSGGACFFLLALFHAIPTLSPLVVIGMNSIVAYLIAHMIHPPGRVFDSPYEPLITGIAVLLLYWIILWGMYRRKWFVRI